MEDLREVGEKAIESVKNLGASNAGDLVLGIGEIIEELRNRPELYQDKLDHLEGLFREFVYGEGYELRNDRVPEDKEDDKFNQMIGWKHGIALSGLRYTHSPYSISGTFVGNPQPLKKPVDILSVPQTSLPIVPVLQDVPKKFKKQWWNKRI